MDRFNNGFHLYINKMDGQLIIRQECVGESLPFIKVAATPLDNGYDKGWRTSSRIIQTQVVV